MRGLFLLYGGYYWVILRIKKNVKIDSFLM